jgi:hypothetical protein
LEPAYAEVHLQVFGGEENIIFHFRDIPSQTLLLLRGQRLPAGVVVASFFFSPPLFLDS